MIEGDRRINILHCYATGRDGDWEGICLDLDIAVQGSSFEEVARSPRDAVSLYLESVSSLPDDHTWRGASAASSTRIRCHSRSALSAENSRAISQAPNASGRTAISAATTR